MNTEQQKAIVRRLYEDMFTKGEVAAAEEIFAPNYVNHESGWPEPLRGPESMRMLVSMFRGALSELTMVVEDQFAVGDKVVTRWSARGTHDAPLFGIPPTGATITHSGISIERLEGGKIVETWVERDKQGMLQQLGGVPDRAPARA